MTAWKNMIQSRDEVFRLKRAAVLREANRIFGRQGYHNTSLDDIAEALQVSKGTLYNYVHDKQEILFECQLMGLELGDRAVEFASSKCDRGYDKLRLVLRAFATWLNQQNNPGGVMADVTALRPDDRKVVIARRDKTQARLLELVEEGLADGSIRPVDPRIAIYTVMSAINATPSWFSSSGRLSPEELADQMVDILGGGLCAPGYVAAPDLPIPERAADDAASADRRRTPKQGANPRPRRRTSEPQT